MQLQITPAAAAFLDEHGCCGDRVLTVTAQLVTSCCGPNLPPTVAMGRPSDPEGFRLVQVGDVDVFVDGLLEPAPETLVLDLAKYERYSELIARVS